MKKITLLFVYALLANNIFSQDTLTVLQYNLLNYGVFSSYCTSTNNDPNLKDNYIKTIVQYVNPDIFTVNEISSSATYQTRILNNTLNVNGINYYKKAVISNTASSDIVNMLYYNSNKLGLSAHYVAQNDVRDIDIFKLYYKSNDLSSGDTIFIHCMTAHLKAGSSPSDETERGIMASNAMAYYKKYFQPGNFMVMGDFNLYTSSEPAFLNFTNFFYQQYSFNDPINSPGNWNNNSSFKDIHTQSTHTGGECFASGGMDDRFDFILASDHIINGTQSVKYIQGTYHAVGQDGQHYNKNLTDLPANTTVPSDVLQALYNNSDHLPVTMKLLVDKSLDIPQQAVFDYLKVSNPSNDNLIISVSDQGVKHLNIRFSDLSGRIVYQTAITSFDGRFDFSIPVEQYAAGIYILLLNSDSEKMAAKKIVVQ